VKRRVISMSIVSGRARMRAMKMHRFLDQFHKINIMFQLTPHWQHNRLQCICYLTVIGRSL
jgi:hypothetical protein